jgi:hypothetical protein
MNDTEMMEAAVTTLKNELKAAVVECAAIIGWHGVLGVVRDAATEAENGYVAGVAQGAADFVAKREGPIWSGAVSDSRMYDNPGE